MVEQVKQAAVQEHRGQNGVGIEARKHLGRDQRPIGVERKQHGIRRRA